MSDIDAKTGLKRDLGLWSAVAIVIGTVIGSGIFIVPSSMIKNVGSVKMLFGVWVFGGLLTLFGALSYAELAAALDEHDIAPPQLGEVVCDARPGDASTDDHDPGTVAHPPRL